MHINHLRGKIFKNGKFDGWANVAGIAYPPSNSPFNHENFSFAFIGCDLTPTQRTTAHEIGHILSDSPDKDTSPWIFFPSFAPLGDDTDVESYRRLSQETIDECYLMGSILLK
ncbi:hypothetical protein ACFL4L_02360 [bacterium]